jgi:tRNA pseudouridine38-40 synthase
LKLALLIEYDGTKFAGWQTQGDHPLGRSVQGEIEKAFHKLFARTITVYGAGRTDAGVHARGMVAHGEFPDDIIIPLSKFILALNGTTPKDIAILDIRPVAGDFHARHSAISRQYRYTIKRERTAIDRNFVWAIRRDLDFVKLEQCAALLIGEHDFTSFSKRTSDVKHYRCIVQESYWESIGNNFVFTIRANRFVRGMVRALVGAMAQVGQSAITGEAFEMLLRSPQELWRAKYISPAHGLVLEGIEYPERFELWEIMKR